MAFKLALRLPFVGRNADAEGASETRATTPAAAGFFARPLPLIGRLAIGRQLQLLTAVLILLLLADGAIVAYDTRQSTIGTMYIATVGKIRMLSERLAQAAQQASQGNAAAFRQPKDSRDELAPPAKLLLGGGTAPRLR